MSDFSTPLASGLRVRTIQTRVVGTDPKTGKPLVAAALDEHGHEIELSAVDVPLHIEAAGAPAITGFVADIQTKGADVALVRADAVIAGTDPAAAETAFT